MPIFVLGFIAVKFLIKAVTINIFFGKSIHNDLMTGKRIRKLRYDNLKLK